MATAEQATLVLEAYAQGNVRRMMNFVLKMMDFALKMMNFVLKMMNFVLASGRIESRQVKMTGMTIVDLYSKTENMTVLHQSFVTQNDDCV